MSLFAQLQHLYRQGKFQLEDFHTEVVAQVLRNNSPLTLAWLRGIGVTELLNPAPPLIATQEEFAKLANHRTDSRPDIAIRLVQDGDVELILIESKVGSRQGPDQLQRYIDQLDTAHDITKTSLLFITRDYEHVNDPIASDPRFTSTRWFEFYRYLQSHSNSDGLEKELQLFMEENGMSLGNQFRALDIVAMENFSRSKALMDETLDGEVSQRATKVLGKVTSSKKAIMQYRDHGRYIIYTGFGKWDFICMIGYWFPGGPDEELWIGIVLASNPKSLIRKEVIKAFRSLANTSKGVWESDRLDDPSYWSALNRGTSIQKFLAQDDHVRAIKDYFLTLLDEVSEFQRSNPKLPWRITSVEEGKES